MKLIHTADLHLGSALDSRFPDAIAKQRRAEVLSTFGRIIDIAKERGARAILISGDLFDSDRPFKRDKQYFFSAVRQNPDIEFFYLRGNHDVRESYDEALPNLHTFSDKPEGYELDDVRITGIELTAGNCESFYTSLSLDKEKTNILMLHGQVADRAGDGLIDPKRLRARGIDYIALGHIHSFSVAFPDKDTTMVYPGTPEGRGFDECGEKGVVLIDTADLKNPTFIRTARRTLHSVRVDVSGASDIYDVQRLIRDAARIPREDLLRVELYGECAFDTTGIERNISDMLLGEYYFITVKDRTRRKISLGDLSCDLSLRAEFLREVLSSDEDEEEKKKIIALGLRALSGDRFDG